MPQNGIYLDIILHKSFTSTTHQRSLLSRCISNLLDEDAPRKYKYVSIHLDALSLIHFCEHHCNRNNSNLPARNTRRVHATIPTNKYFEQSHHKPPKHSNNGELYELCGPPGHPARGPILERAIASVKRYPAGLRSARAERGRWSDRSTIDRYAEVA